MNGLGQRIKAAADRIGGLDALSPYLTDISRRTLSDWANDKTEPRASSIAEICHATGASIEWLLSGEGVMFDASSTGTPRAPTAGVDDFDQPGMLTIPRYDEVRPSAGPGAMATSEAPTTRVAFERHWLADIGVRADAAMILPAQGDSMEPTIMNGSPMLVDTSKTEIQNGYIYVIAVENDLLVKRVRRRLDGKIDLISDNPAYGPETLDAADLQQLRVIGRVYAAVSKF
ncbi:XRE family transcriptional regulator [Ruixingdingia sedimenti]|uniref:Helix-turn-helix transcriptional regulator n=1 Tax=Ruixingdingia sedimenti TaxID=3073604 RepID=A0ABU1FF02_9RHOB|nr:helix-turn-helix transcriptional regulator [Xinfangfangia sp. LG-4]MDR5655488.1 helix-turn-helix transcriptional regulator [Xinfangfangia sp. LG-4]